MSKNLILALQVVLSGIFLFLAYAGKIKPNLSFVWAAAICVTLIVASRILLNKRLAAWGHRCYSDSLGIFGNSSAQLLTLLYKLSLLR